MHKGLSTKLVILILKGIALFPFPVIYAISDIFFVLVYYLIGYRKKVVLTNLQNAFPEKSAAEHLLIAKKYYRHFADLTLETIKMWGMTKKDFRKRMIVTNPELVNDLYDKGKSVVVLTMHYNNWEWSTSFPLFLQHKIFGVYKPLNNKLFDQFMNKMRGKPGVHMIPNASVLRQVLKSEKLNEKVFTWLAGDQTPLPSQNFWFRFMNQDALFYPGPAFISKKFKHPVVFQRLEKIGRGRYRTSFEMLFENPEKHSAEEIMGAYIKKMEELIAENPEFYLWSHRRWKHNRPADQHLNNAQPAVA